MQIDKAHDDQLAWLVDYLEREEGTKAEAGSLWDQFRALVNMRKPQRASDEFYMRQDELLQQVIKENGITKASELPCSEADNRLSVWRGDITTIEADAIVNAANSQMLGCWVPGHHCIDNAIHTFAGVQLREECATLMFEQGHEEPTAQAKVTLAYNLPAKRVIHTVGPIAAGHPSELHCQQLAQAYASCLDAASACGCESLVFCCISTGVFGFPQKQAAEIALHSVRGWLDEHEGANMHVVFNVFGRRDEDIYRAMLQAR